MAEYPSMRYRALYWTKCAVPNCNNMGKDIKLYGSPKAGNERFLKWAEFAERKNQGFFYICQCHFERKCFSFLGPVPRLLPRSIPTLKTSRRPMESPMKNWARELNVTSNVAAECIAETIKSKKPLERVLQESGEFDDEEERLPKNPTSQLQSPTSTDQVSALSEKLIAFHDIAQWKSSKKVCENEYEEFGKLVACHLKQLPVDTALGCQKRIQNYLVKKRWRHIRNTLGPVLCDELLSPHSTSIPAPSFTT